MSSVTGWSPTTPVSSRGPSCGRDDPPAVSSPGSLRPGNGKPVETHRVQGRLVRDPASHSGQVVPVVEDLLRMWPGERDLEALRTGLCLRGLRAGRRPGPQRCRQPGTVGSPRGSRYPGRITTASSGSLTRAHLVCTGKHSGRADRHPHKPLLRWRRALGRNRKKNPTRGVRTATKHQPTFLLGEGKVKGSRCVK